jgi:hypothetical protein
VKRTGKRTWRPECVVLVVEGGGGISEGVVVGVAVIAGLKVVVPQSSSLLMPAKVNCESVWANHTAGSSAQISYSHSRYFRRLRG